MQDIKFQVEPNKYPAMAARIAQQFPQWTQQRLVQTAVNKANVVIVHPLGGYQLSEAEQAALSDIIAAYEVYAVNWNSAPVALTFAAWQANGGR
jgi:uncharacterized FlgJ-related protein